MVGLQFGVRAAGVRSASAQQAVGQGRGRRRVAGDEQHGVVAGDGAQHVGQADLVEGGGQELRRARAACAARRGWPLPSAETSRSAQQAGSSLRGRRGLRAVAAVAALGARVDRRRAVGPRSFTAPSSSRSRDSVAWVTLDAVARRAARPARAASVTSCAPSSSTMRALPGRLAGRAASWRHERSSSQVSSAFWACSRFSASSQTALCGPSITAAAISLPR